MDVACSRSGAVNTFGRSCCLCFESKRGRREACYACVTVLRGLAFTSRILLALAQAGSPSDTVFPHVVATIALGDLRENDTRWLPERSLLRSGSQRPANAGSLALSWQLAFARASFSLSGGVGAREQAFRDGRHRRSHARGH